MNFRRLVVELVVALIGALVLAGPTLAAKVDGAKHGGRPFSTTLTGRRKSPDPARTAVTGLKHLWLDAGYEGRGGLEPKCGGRA